MSTDSQTVPPSQATNNGPLLALAHPTIVLLGGSIGTGKTTLARALASEIEPECLIGTSILRNVLSAAHPDLPDDYYSRSLLELTKEHLEHYPQTNIDVAMEGYKRQAAFVVKGVEVIIKRITRRKTCAIIEGTHLFPSVFDHLRDNRSVFEFIVTVSDPEEHRKRVTQRHYMPTIAERFRQGIITLSDTFQERYIDTAVRMNATKKPGETIPIIDHDSSERCVREIITTINTFRNEGGSNVETGV